MKARHLMGRRSGQCPSPQYELQVDVSISVSKEGEHECEVLMARSWRES